MRTFSKIVAILLLMNIARVLDSAEADYSIPGDVQMVIPSIPGIKIQSVMPVNLESSYADCHSFDIDSKGVPWFGYEHRLIADPLRQVLLIVDVPYEDFAWLSNGEFIVCTDTDIGYLARKSKGKAGPVVTFKPAIRLPYEDFRIFPGEKNSMYLVGRNPNSGIYEVYLLKEEKRRGSIQKLYATWDEISAVAGDGKSTYVTAGSFIIKIVSGQNKSHIVFDHPEMLITDLAFSSKSGLFYATRSAVGFVGSEKNFEFMESSNCRIRIKNEILYIFMGESHGVLQIEGINKFKDFKGIEDESKL